MFVVFIISNTYKHTQIVYTGTIYNTTVRQLDFLVI